MQAVKLQLATLLTFFFLCQLLVAQGVRMSDSFIVRTLVLLPSKDVCLLGNRYGAGNPYRTENSLMQGFFDRFFSLKSALCSCGGRDEVTVAWLPYLVEGLLATESGRATDNGTERLKWTQFWENKSCLKSRMQMILPVRLTGCLFSSREIASKNDLYLFNERLLIGRKGIVYQKQPGRSCNEQLLIVQKGTPKSFFELLFNPGDPVFSQQDLATSFNRSGFESVLTGINLYPVFSGIGDTSRQNKQLVVLRALIPDECT